MPGHRLRDTPGSDLATIEHTSPNVEPGDVHVGGQLMGTYGGADYETVTPEPHFGCKQLPGSPVALIQ